MHSYFLGIVGVFIISGKCKAKKHKKHMTYPTNRISKKGNFSTSKQIEMKKKKTF